MGNITDAVAEVLDAIGDDEEYAPAHAALEEALIALATGTTAQAHDALNRAQRLIDQACPI